MNQDLVAAITKHRNKTDLSGKDKQATMREFEDRTIELGKKASFEVCLSIAEWSKFQLHSIFQRGVNGPQNMTPISIKTQFRLSLVFLKSPPKKVL